MYSPSFLTPRSRIHDPHSSVSSLSFAPPRRWRRVKKCAGTKELVCSLMCLEKQDLCNKFKGRVQAVSPSARSPWVESKFMDYFFEGREGTCEREAVCPGAQLSGTAVCPSHLPSTSPKQWTALESSTMGPSLQSKQSDFAIRHQSSPAPAVQSVCV